MGPDLAPDPSADVPADDDPSEEDAPDLALSTEFTVGGVLVGLALLGAIVFRAHPGQTVVDSWGFSFVHPALGNTIYRHVVDLKALPFVVGGSILAALVVVARDRLRALACLVGPVAAVVLAEWVFKPLVARRYAEVLTYPSGTTTAVAGVVAAFAIAVPRRLRPAVVVVGAFLVGLECLAVVGLQWHFPTDALAGAALGAGTVLLLDGVLHVAADRLRGTEGPPAEVATTPDATPGA